MTNHTSDERVDRLLGDYFKAQLPTHWPAAPRTAAAHPATPATDPGTRSRWALAASVAVLVGGCWYLSGHLGEKARKGYDLDGGTADPTVNIKGLKKPTPEPKVGMP